MQNFKDLYLELSEKIDQLAPIEWVDLWHNQVNFLEEEHPFPSPAVFLQFRSRNIEDIGEKIQNINLQVDCFLFFETFADTFKGSASQNEALEFLNALDLLQKLLHGSDGTHYSNMRRIAVNPVDTGGAGNLYQLSFECELLDYEAQDLYNQEEIPNDILFDNSNDFKL